jgi:hypothetical protein
LLEEEVVGVTPLVKYNINEFLVKKTQEFPKRHLGQCFMEKS